MASRMIANLICNTCFELKTYKEMRKRNGEPKSMCLSCYKVYKRNLKDSWDRTKLLNAVIKKAEKDRAAENVQRWENTAVAHAKAGKLFCYDLMQLKTATEILINL